MALMKWYGNDVNVQANNPCSRLYDAVAIWFKNIKAKNNIGFSASNTTMISASTAVCVCVHECAESDRTAVKWMKQMWEPKVRPRIAHKLGRCVELLSNGRFSCWCGFPCCVRFTKHCGPLCFRKPQVSSIWETFLIVFQKYLNFLC